MDVNRFNIQDHLRTSEDRIRYLEAVLDEGDPARIVAALGDIASAQRLSSLDERLERFAAEGAVEV